MSKVINNTDNFLLTAIVLTLPLLAAIVLISALYYLDWPALIPGLIISYAAVYIFYFKKSGRIKPLAICFLATIFCYFSGAVFYDFSIDSRQHFNESIIQLVEGWNPTRTGIPVSSLWSSVVWCDKYPIGLQMLSASIFKLTGDLQVGKGVLFILMLAGFTASYSALRQKVSRRTALLCSTVLVVNPVVIWQMWSGLLDGAMYLLFLISLALFSHVRKGDYFNSQMVARNYVGHLILATVLAAILVFPVIKMSGFAYSLALYLVLLYRLKSRPYLLLGLSLAGLALFIIIGYKPYFMYPPEDFPVLLDQAFDPSGSGLDGHIAPVELFLNHFRAIFTAGETTSFQALFTYLVTYIDYHYAPFGLIYGLIWLWSLVYFFTLILRGRGKGPSRFEFFIFFVAIIPPLMVPAFICQRYYPIQYLFPLTMLMRLYLSGRPGAAATALALLLINPTIYLINHLEENIIFTNHLNSSLQELASQPEKKYLQVAVTGLGSETWSQSALSDRLFFKDLNVPIYLPTTVLSLPSTETRFKKGLESKIKPLVNHQGLMVVADFSDHDDYAGRPARVLKISLDNLDKSTSPAGVPKSAVMMYVRDNRRDPFSHRFDSYYRWRVSPLKDELFLDIPYYVNVVIVVGTEGLFIKKAEIRETDWPALTTSEQLHPR